MFENVLITPIRVKKRLVVEGTCRGRVVTRPARVKRPGEVLVVLTVLEPGQSNPSSLQRWSLRRWARIPFGNGGGFFDPRVSWVDARHLSIGSKGDQALPADP